MIATNSKTRSVVNDLIETCKDGQEGFRVASENVNDAAIKKSLAEFSLQRSKFAGELQQAAIQLGEHDPEDSGSTAGKIHQGWINLKTAIAGKDIYQVLAECEAGEDSAVKEYKKALEAELPGDLHSLVSAQFVTVKATHDTVKGLRDAAKKS